MLQYECLLLLQAEINSSVPILIEESAELKEIGCVYSVVDDILIVQSTYDAILEPGTATALPNRTAVGIVKLFI